MVASNAAYSICVLEMKVFLKIAKQCYQKTKEVKYILYIKNRKKYKYNYKNINIYLIKLIFNQKFTFVN